VKGGYPSNSYLPYERLLPFGYSDEEDGLAYEKPLLGWDMNKKSIHWTNGNTLCESKARGGLGFKGLPISISLFFLSKGGGYW
ncbi:hypothetical protein LINPERHAP2_LOCUS16727, partial [Linum perenne]